ncbi:MAG: riboflavin kinase [Candidatus Gracilibacteria bacterium]
MSIFSGQVISGHGRGRTIGFPTLNLKLTPTQVSETGIEPGVYGVRAHVNGAVFYGGMHFGPRPTFDEKDPTVELHLVGFSGEKVDGEVRVEVLKRLRGIRTFVSQEALKKQIEKDMMAVKKMAHAQ